MRENFWNNLPKPFFVLAPLANVTDAAFRRIIAKYGKPDVLWTEFVSADGLFLAKNFLDKNGEPTADHPLLLDLQYTQGERPIIAQFFTASPERMEKAARLALKLGFNGIDINMGCPDRTIEKQGAGAALIKTPELAMELIEAAQRGAGGLPVSVKTRIGYYRDEIETWIPKLLSAKPAAITLHARTRKEMSLVPARFEHVKRVVELRNEHAPEVLIIGNGDALSIEDARAKVQETGCDGVMLGRAIFGNPWLFSETIPSIQAKLHVMVEHTKLFEELLGANKNIAIMKKHYKAYVNGFDGAKELRMQLMEAKDISEIERLTKEFTATLERQLTSLS